MSKKRLVLSLILPLAVLAAACGGGGEQAAAPAPAAAPAAAPAGGSGSIHGTVMYANGDPDTVIAMDADPVCAGLHDSAVNTEMVVANDAGGLANVFVYVKDGLSGNFSAPADKHVLDQKGCQYFPHVSGMMVGQTLVVHNSDPTLHNVHALPEKNAEFNQGQPFQGMELERKFDQAEVMIRFKCDVHPWMSSYMAVVNHPFFAVSGADGSFSIEGLPAGTYTLEAWHETMGTQSQQVTVGDGESVEASWSFGETAG